MKKILVPLLLFLTIAVPLASSAADKTVTVEWTMPTASIADIQNYALNFSPNSDMQGATPQTCEPWQQTGTQGELISFTMTCNNVSIIEGQLAYFTLKAVDNEGNIALSNIFSKTTKPSTVLNFQVIPPSANILPTAVINYTLYGNTVNFDASESTDSDGSIVEHRWNFGDGTTGNGITVNHQFTNGSYPITLTVEDNSGEISSDLVILDIDSAPTSSYSFYWSAETDNADYPLGKTAVYTGNSILRAAAAKYGLTGLDTASETYSNASFPIINNDIADPNKGTVEFWINVQTWSGGRRMMFMKSSLDGRNYIGLVLGGLGEVHAQSRIAGAYNTTATINVSEIGENEWFHIIIRWDFDADYISIESNGNIATNNSVTGVWDNIPNHVLIGSGDTYGMDIFVDDIKIYKNPQEVIQ